MGNILPLSRGDGYAYRISMGDIRILTDRVANQIAAGEVVERPAAVVKELIENSIDAEATKIELEFRNGGKSYLRIEDDGHGMTQDQALLSLERHGTSKIRKASDLNEISTFGFRGEALPSISSVSRFVMRTRAKTSKEGSEIFVNGGKLVHVKDCGMPPGTRIEVSHLFNSVPGRRKFLKTESTESTHIIHLAKLYALAHPQIEFTLFESGRTIFRSPACDDILDRVREIFGKSLAEALAPISVQKEGMQIEGLVGKPGQSRSTRKEMIFFVNRRPVESKTISYAVLESYHTYAPKGRFPPAILFVNVDPEEVDVNVHPAKREIRFRNDFKIRTFLIEGLLARNQELASRIEMVKPAVQLEQEDGTQNLVPQIDPQALEIYRKRHDRVNIPKLEKDIFSSMGGGSKESDKIHGDSKFKSAQSSEGIEKVGPRDTLTGIWRFLDQPRADLAVFASPEGIVFFHARAAYERTIFEQMEDAFQESKKADSQALLFPESIELDGIDQKNLSESIEKLELVGFCIEEFGRNFYRIEGCPKWIEPEVALQFLKDFLEFARESGGVPNPEKLAREVLIQRSTSDPSNRNGYTDNEVIRLAERLLTCRNPYSCPKGRPTFYEIPWRDLETKFKRNL